MKFYFSPLFIVSSLLLLFGLYLFIESKFVNPRYWDELFAMPLVFIGATGIIVHFLFKKIIGNNIRVQLLVELALILSAILLLAIS